MIAKKLFNSMKARLNINFYQSNIDTLKSFQTKCAFTCINVYFYGDGKSDQ